VSIQLGDTFYWKDGGHLWVVVSDPNLHGGEFVIVNLTKDVFLAGKECELNPGDHTWIIAKTYVYYGKARKVGLKEAANLLRQITLGTIKKHIPIDPNILNKIIAAGKTSKAISEDLKMYL
jgi:hypothetical protein